MSNYDKRDNISFNGQSTYYQQLFPYLYLGNTPNIGNTPKVSDQDRANAFFVVPTSISDMIISSIEGIHSNVSSDEKKKPSWQKVQQWAVTFINSVDFIGPATPLDERLLAMLVLEFEALTNVVEIQFFIELHFKNIEAFKEFKLASTMLTKVWSSIMSMLIELDYELYWLEKLICLVKKINIITLALPYLTNDYDIPASLLTSWKKANLILPKALFPLSEQHKGENIPISRAYALGTLHFVKYKLTGYELGELKKVETVLKGETRKQSSRQLTKNHTLVNDDTTNNQEQNQLQHLVDKDLTSQVQKTLADRLVTTTANDYTTSYQSTEPNATTKGSWTVDESPAGGQSENHIKFIKDVLAETKDRVASHVNQARQTKIEHEHEYSAVNTFTNPGDENINGFYYWLNKTYSVSASDSQKRLLVEINVPLQDGELHQLLAEQGQLAIQPPITLKQYGINSYNDILLEEPSSQPSAQDTAVEKSKYYLYLCQQFSATPTEAPPLTRVIATTVKSEQCLTNTTLPIPDGFLIESGNIVISADDNIEILSVVVAGESITVNNPAKDTYIYSGVLTSEVLNKPINGSLPIAILAKANSQNGKDATSDISMSQNISIQLQLTPSEQTKKQWKFALFTQLQAAYQQQLADYNKKSAEFEKWLQVSSTPKTQALINHYLIKKCMYSLYLKAMFNTVGVSTEPLEQLPYDQYVNHALEWSNMYCKLTEEMPDTSTSKAEVDTKSTVEYSGTGSVLAQLDSELYLKKFLTATNAKLLIPVNVGQEISFIYFLDSGQIWHGKEGLTPVNEQALPIINDFKKLKNTYEYQVEDKGEWTVTLPTSMNVLSDRDDADNIGSHLNER